MTSVSKILVVLETCQWGSARSWRSCQKAATGSGPLGCMPQMFSTDQQAIPRNTQATKGTLDMSLCFQVPCFLSHVFPIFVATLSILNTVPVGHILLCVFRAVPGSSVRICICLSKRSMPLGDVSTCCMCNRNNFDTNPRKRNKLPRCIVLVWWDIVGPLCLAQGTESTEYDEYVWRWLYRGLGPLIGAENSSTTKVFRISMITAVYFERNGSRLYIALLPWPWKCCLLLPILTRCWDCIKADSLPSNSENWSTPQNDSRKTCAIINSTFRNATPRGGWLLLTLDHRRTKPSIKLILQVPPGPDIGAALAAALFHRLGSRNAAAIAREPWGSRVR